MSSSLLAAVGVMLLCQAFKVVYYSCRERRIYIGYLFSSGGMPSAHSAFVTALTVSLGLRYGFASEYFAISCVFSFIIIYDSLRLRGTVQIHSRLIGKLLARSGVEMKPKLPWMGGHTLPEIIIGVAVGAVFACLAVFII